MTGGAAQLLQIGEETGKGMQRRKI